ncbi:Nucleotide-sugar transporter domain containing protein [Amanita muscaria]
MRLSWAVKAADARHDEDIGIGNDIGSPNVPSIWGIPLKYISLVTLAVQNSTLTIIMHHSRISTPPSRAYSAATAVLLNEIVKGLISFSIAFARIDPCIYAQDSGQNVHISSWNLGTFRNRLRRLIKDILSPDCWKLSIPATLYVIQNNLQYVAASNLDAATFQVTYQMKILTTAAFSVLLLRRKLTSSQWLALSFLAIGVGIVQLQASAAKFVSGSGFRLAEPHSMNGLKGFAAVALACFTSGLAGVYFEMVLKNTLADLWVRNVQLSLFSLLPALAPILISHAQKSDSAVGWFFTLFHNFGPWAWATVAVQVLGGLLTAVVIKYSDNILKGFATSLSIVLSFLASVALFDFTLTGTFLLGSTIVLVATWLYNQTPNRSTNNIMLVLSAKESAGGWHLPFPVTRSEKVKDDPIRSQSAMPTPINLNLSTVSSSSSLWSLFSLNESGDSVRLLDKQDGLYPR